jgi:hypothetical protein
VPAVQVSDVASETIAALRRRAAARHQSLQQYLRQLLIQQAETDRTAEGERPTGSLSFQDVAEMIRTDRRWREATLVRRARIEPRRVGDNPNRSSLA